MKTPALLLRQSVALALGASGLLVLTGCMDRDLAGPSRGGPLFSELSAEAESCRVFVIPLSGGGNEGRTTSATLCAAHDEVNWYLTLQLQDPANNAGDVLRVLLRKDGSLIWDEIIFTGGGYSDRYRDDVDNDGFQTSHVDNVQHGSGDRAGTGGRTTYTVTKPRYPKLADGTTADPQDLVLDGIVEFRVQLQQGTRSGYYPSEDGWAEYDFDASGGIVDDPNIPNLYVIVEVPSTAPLPCGGTVGLRGTDDRETFLIAQALWDTGKQKYIATFIDVPLSDEGYVPSVHNVCDDDPAHWNTWPIPDFHTTEALGNFDGTVYNWEDEHYYIAIPDNYYDAVTAASNNRLVADTEIALALLENERGVVTCKLPDNTAFPALVFSMVTLDADRIPAFTSADPPAWGIHVGSVGSSDGKCEQKGLFLGQYIHAEARDREGKIFRTLIEPDQTEATFFESSDFEEVSYDLHETYGDANHNDIAFPSWGLVLDGSTRYLGIDFLTRGLNPKGLAQYGVAVVLNPGTPLAQTISWMVTNGRSGSDTWQVKDVSPKRMANRIVVTGELDPSTGEGVIRGLVLLGTGENVADFRIRESNRDAGNDIAPNDKGYYRWDGSGGGSLTIRF